MNDMNVILEDSLSLLRNMVSIPSVSFEEGRVASLIESFLKSKGLAACRYGPNIVCTTGYHDASKPTLVLDAHIDTVAPSQGYTRNPYDAGDDPEIIYGLGSNDDGGSVVSMIAAFRHFAGLDNFPINVVLALSGEEERSGPGGAAFLYGPDGPSEVRDARWVIVGEPTGMRVAVSERGLLVLDAQATGVSGHAAREEGVNALYIALEDINALRSHVFGKVSTSMGQVRLNVTQINAGCAHNVIPDSCKFVVDIRPTECYTNEEILSELQLICRSTLTARNLTNRSSATYALSPLLEAAGKLGMETFSSPTTSNWMRTHKDAVKMGPGDSSRSHRADEYILRDEIFTAVEKYIAFIDTLANGNTLE